MKTENLFWGIGLIALAVVLILNALGIPAPLSELAGGSAAIEVTDIEALTNEQLDALQVGDKVVKVTGKQKHLYLVTYKGEGAGEGIVITCNFCGYSEAISYDRSGEGWVFNSKDVKTYGE